MMNKITVLSTEIQQEILELRRNITDDKKQFDQRFSNLEAQLENQVTMLNSLNASKPQP